MLVFTIQKEEADQTIISFLKKRFKTTPLSLIYKLFRNKKIKVEAMKPAPQIRAKSATLAMLNWPDGK